MVEKDISRKAQPVLFDWRGIQYPQEWECKYDELRNVEALQASLRSQPITFDKQNSSFRMPNITPFPRFSLAEANPTFTRSASSSTFVDRILSPHPSNLDAPSQENTPSESFTGLQDTEHRGQHTDCPACRKRVEKLRRHRKTPHLGMFSLPRENESYEIERDGRKSYFPGRNLPTTPFRQYTPDGLSKREYLPLKTVETGETPSDEVILSN